MSLPKKEMSTKWSGRVLEVGWHDQVVPPLERLCSVCRALDSWLQAHPHHVAVIHSRYFPSFQSPFVILAASFCSDDHVGSLLDLAILSHCNPVYHPSLFTGFMRPRGNARPAIQDDSLLSNFGYAGADWSEWAWWSPPTGNTRGSAPIRIKHWIALQ